MFRTKTVPTPLEVSNLWSFGSSTIDTGAFDAGRFAIIVRNLLNLLSQLSGWSEHQTLHRQSRAERRVGS